MYTNGQGTDQAPPAGEGETSKTKAKTPVAPHRGLQWHPNPRLPPNGPLTPRRESHVGIMQEPRPGGSTLESDSVLSLHSRW